MNTKMNEMPLVFIIILNYNGWEDTIECLESVLRIDYPNYKVLLIDNASENDSIQRIKSWADGTNTFELNTDTQLNYFRYPQINKPIRFSILDEQEFLQNKNFDFSTIDLLLVKNEYNLGFAGGNNIGINAAINHNADYCLLLNNDTVVTKDFLSNLVSESEKNTKYAFMGSSILQYQNPKKVWAAGGGKVNKFTAITKHNSLNKNVVEIENQIKEIDYVTGCCLLVSTNTIKKLGLMNENYFLYFEETDWCMRAAKFGLKNIFVPSSVIYHKEVSRKKKADTTGTYYYTRNRNYFIQYNFAGIQKIIMRLSVFIYNQLRIIYHLLQGNNEKVNAIRMALTDYRAQRMGKR